MSAEDVVIVPYRDGPYLVRGPLVLRDQDGRTIELTRRTVALCRCGKSRMRPFCDGTHRLAGFRAPSTPEDPWSEEPREARSVAPAASPSTRSSNGGGSSDFVADRLRRARAGLDDLGAHDGAGRNAAALLDGASRLLEGPRSGGATAAALHLIEGALQALAQVRDRRVTASIDELTAVASALTSGTEGSCRS